MLIPFHQDSKIKTLTPHGWGIAHNYKKAEIRSQFSI